LSAVVDMLRQLDFNLNIIASNTKKTAENVATNTINTSLLAQSFLMPGVTPATVGAAGNMAGSNGKSGVSSTGGEGLNTGATDESVQMKMLGDKSMVSSTITTLTRTYKPKNLLEGMEQLNKLLLTKDNHDLIWYLDQKSLFTCLAQEYPNAMQAEATLALGNNTNIMQWQHELNTYANKVSGSIGNLK
jgi:hypothetical protein